MYVVIAGCGRVGARLATDMAADGHNVVVIDRESTAFGTLGPTFNGVTLLGTAIDEDTLREAGIERADAFAATTSLDNVNIMAAQMARELFHVPKVAARVLDPSRETFFRELGLNPICATNLAAGELYSILALQGLHHRRNIAAGEIVEVEIVVAADAAGQSLADLEVPGERRVFAVVRDGQGIIPDAAYRTAAGDRLLAAVCATALPALERRLHQSRRS